MWKPKARKKPQSKLPKASTPYKGITIGLSYSHQRLSNVFSIGYFNGFQSFKAIVCNRFNEKYDCNQFVTNFVTGS